VDEINELKRSGMSIQAISELTGYDRKTIRKYLLKLERPVDRTRPAPAGKLDPFNRHLNERLQAGVWNGRFWCGSCVSATMQAAGCPGGQHVTQL
jgi:transposase